MAYTPLQLAEAFIQTGEVQDALDALNQHLDANPADDAARRLRAQVLMRLRDEDSLRAALADLEQISNKTASDYLTKVIVLEQLHDFEAALNTAADLHRQFPADEQIAERCFWLLMGQRHFAAAAQLLSVMPLTSDWLSKAGHLATEDGHEDQAPGYFTQALDHLAQEFDLASDAFAKPIHANLLVSRAQAYANLSRFPEADNDYKAAQAVMPDDPLIPFWGAFVVAELGRTNEAIDLWRSTLAAADGKWFKTMMIENLKALADQPKFARLAALLDSATP